jgi:hypothetical protein
MHPSFTQQPIMALRRPTRLSRRRFALLAAAATGAIVLPGRTTRSAPTRIATMPATPPADPLAGYPELKMISTDTELTLPKRIAAGRYLVTIENRATLGESAPAIVLLPEGRTAAELLTDPGDPSSVAEWFYDAPVVGAPIAPLGTMAQAIVDFAPGRYAVWGEPFQSVIPELEVESGSSASSEEPEAEAVITIGNGSLNGVPEQVAPGKHLWQVTATGAGFHRFQLYSYPEPITLDQLFTAFAVPPGETPPAGVPDLALAVQLGGLGVLSAGRTGWPVLDLEPGTYVAMCAVGDAETGVQHGPAGEIAIFTVGGGPIGAGGFHGK